MAQPNLGFPQHSDDLFWCIAFPAHLHLLQEVRFSQILTLKADHYFGPRSNEFGDGCGEKRDAGLSYLGEELVEASNELPIMLDLSHCGHQTRADTAALARAPVCTHSNADGRRPNGRNTTDDTPALDDLLDHVDHIAALVGTDHVGIGVDYVERYA